MSLYLPSVLIPMHSAIDIQTTALEKPTMRKYLKNIDGIFPCSHNTPSLDLLLEFVAVYIVSIATAHKVHGNQQHQLY